VFIAIILIQIDTHIITKSIFNLNFTECRYREWSCGNFKENRYTSSLIENPPGIPQARDY